jgi:AraC-like DNA-binding protein
MDFSELSLSTPSIPVGYSRLVARTLGLVEKNLHLLLANTQLNTSDLLRDDTSITGTQQIRILSNALDVSGDEAFGLHFGQNLIPPTHGPLGFLVHSSSNLIDAMEAFTNFLPLRMNLTQMDISTSPEWLECHFHANPQINDKIYRLVIEALSLGVFAITEFILGRPLTEGHLQLLYPAPNYKAQYRRFYPCEVHFSASSNTLRIPIALINTPNASAEHNNYEYALNQCKSLLDQLNEGQLDTKTKVRKLLLSHPNHQLSEDAVAATMFISKRTLARRLNTENTGFREVRDDVLSSLASGYLLDTHLSVDAIASLLNYHDSSNFRRAFKRWHTMPPEKFRSKHKAQ